MYFPSVVKTSYMTFDLCCRLTTSLQPQCPGDGFSSKYSFNVTVFNIRNSDLKFRSGQHQFPPMIPPPTMVVHESLAATSPSPAQTGGGAFLSPKTSVPGTLALPGASAASSPAGSASQAVCVVPSSYISVLAYPLVAWNFAKLL